MFLWKQWQNSLFTDIVILHKKFLRFLNTVCKKQSASIPAIHASLSTQAPIIQSGSGTPCRAIDGALMKRLHFSSLLFENIGMLSEVFLLRYTWNLFVFREKYAICAHSDCIKKRKKPFFEVSSAFIGAMLTSLCFLLPQWLLRFPAHLFLLPAHLLLLLPHPSAHASGAVLQPEWQQQPQSAEPYG